MLKHLLGSHQLEHGLQGLGTGEERRERQIEKEKPAGVQGGGKGGKEVRDERGSNERRRSVRVRALMAA